MAESLGVPEDHDDTPTRHRYPWAEWAKRPFSQWLLVPGVDFFVSPRQMDIAIRVYASRNRLGVVTTYSDPAAAGRVAFCFYERDGRRPKLSAFGGGLSMSAEGIATQVSPTHAIECALCGTHQTRAPHMTHILECLVRNQHDPRDSALYALHRPDPAETAGMRKVEPVGTTWTVEGGPVPLF